MSTTLARILGKRSAVIHCLTDCDTTNVPMCLYHEKVVPIKLIENPSPLVHLHSKQSRKTNKELFQALINDMKVRKGAKIRNRYNQVPHMTRDTNRKMTNSQIDITNESQKVSPFPAGDNHVMSNCDVNMSCWRHH